MNPGMFPPAITVRDVISTEQKPLRVVELLHCFLACTVLLHSPKWSSIQPTAANLSRLPHVQGITSPPEWRESHRAETTSTNQHLKSPLVSIRTYGQYPIVFQPFLQRFLSCSQKITSVLVMLSISLFMAWRSAPAVTPCCTTDIESFAFRTNISKASSRMNIAASFNSTQPLQTSIPGVWPGNWGTSQDMPRYGFFFLLTSWCIETT